MLEDVHKNGRGSKDLAEAQRLKKRVRWDEDEEPDDNSKWIEG